jgi:hypothetical protein
MSPKSALLIGRDLAKRYTSCTYESSCTNYRTIIIIVIIVFVIIKLIIILLLLNRYQKRKERRKQQEQIRFNEANGNVLVGRNEVAGAPMFGNVHTNSMGRETSLPPPYPRQAQSEKELEKGVEMPTMPRRPEESVAPEVRRVT